MTEANAALRVIHQCGIIQPHHKMKLQRAAGKERQLQHKLKLDTSPVVFMALSYDMRWVVHLAIVIRGVDDTLTVTEEFVELVPMKDITTAADTFTTLDGVLDRVGVDWSHAINDREKGKFREKVQTANGGHDFWT
ncbi:general transcription factor II-I repeat domain-containing protein 2-like%2C partial [Xyrichtys novacula]|uniref:General transcription factor II-I repeat domain-containing protein 2-like, partial n=1 Tax=Xyrichtys novacula TaxID=13765 RepID=A0AAV1GM08_XYRNO|nr:general transcription factor II-I repeat domain-containing protein 2-like%2C partial [Xyrichtys novacula]